MIQFASHYHLKRRITVALSILFGISVCMYVTFVLVTIFATAARADAARASRDATARIAALELKYLTLDQSLTKDRARALGFVAPVSHTLVYLDPEAPKLSFRPE